MTFIHLVLSNTKLLTFIHSVYHRVFVQFNTKLLNPVYALMACFCTSLPVICLSHNVFAVHLSCFLALSLPAVLHYIYGELHSSE